MLRRMARALLSGKGQTSARVLIFCRNHLCSPHYLSFLSLLFSPFFNRQESKKPIVLWVGAIAPDSSYLCSTSFVSLKSGSEFHFVFFLFFQIINADLIIRTAARLLFSFLFFFFCFHLFRESGDKTKPCFLAATVPTMPGGEQASRRPRLPPLPPPARFDQRPRPSAVPLRRARQRRMSSPLPLSRTPPRCLSRMVKSTSRRIGWTRSLRSRQPSSRASCGTSTVSTTSSRHPRLSSGACMTCSCASCHGCR